MKSSMQGNVSFAKIRFQILTSYHQQNMTSQLSIIHLERALHANPDIPSPVGNGWSLSGDVLEVVWMESLPVPESVLALITCDCHRLKWNASCQFKILSLECADICKCHANCENVS